MSPRNFRLVTLGRLTLEGAEGDPSADALRRQRRKLVVLAVLALAREPLSRDALVDMFWGEQDEARARHSLSEALSHLRRVLGPQAIGARGTDVALEERAGLRVDARELDAAASAGRWGEVLALYGGPFLDAVHAGGSARLEAWLERERRPRAALHLRACEAEYRRLRAAEQWEEASALARRWLDADPLAEAAALALLGALEAPGTAEADARALGEYETLCARLSREYGTAPGPRLGARAAVLAERLAAAPPSAAPVTPVALIPNTAASAPVALIAATAAPVVSTASATSTTSMAPAGSAAAESAPAASAPAGVAEGPAQPGRRRRRRRWAYAAACLALVAVAVGFWPRRAPPRVSARTVAVLPFNVRGSAELAYLREGIVDLLSADLDGAGPFHSVDPQAVLVAARDAENGGRADGARAAAERLGAGFYVTGDAVVAGGRLRIAATLFSGAQGGGHIGDATAEGASDDLFRLVDLLAARLLAASGSPVPPLGRLAALTTSSLPALKLYLEGENDFRRGLYASAFEAFRSAAQQDTSFGLAHYRVAQAASWAVPPGWGWDSILGRSRLAAAHASHLGPRARLLVEAYAAWTAGAYDDAERAYRAVVRTYPDEVEAWYGLGEVLFHTNAMRGRSFVESGEPFQRVRELEPEHLGALSHLLRVRLRQDRRASVDSLVLRLDALASPLQRIEYHTLRAFAYGDEPERERALAALRLAHDDELLRITANRLASYTRDDGAAVRVLPLLLDGAFAPDVRAHALVWLAQLEVAHGRWRAAEPQLAAAAALDPALALEERALLAALPFAPDGIRRAGLARAALERWDAARTPPTTYPWLAVYNGLHPQLREYLLGVLALREGDAQATGRSTERLASLGTSREGRELARGLSESLRAHAAAAAGQPAEALIRFDSARLRVSEGLLESQFGSQTYERWVRAELLFRAGRWREALPWYASLAETFIDGLIYLGPAEERQGEICERLGDRPAAAAHYTRFLQLWRTADPELLPRVEQARARLRALAAAGSR